MQYIKFILHDVINFRSYKGPFHVLGMSTEMVTSILVATATPNQVSGTTDARLYNNKSLGSFNVKMFS